MKGHIIGVLLTLLFRLAFAQGNLNDYKFDVAVHMWNNFTFTINGVEQKMNLYYFDDGKVKGRYYENCEKKILFEGTRKDNVLSLTGYYNNRVYCYVAINASPDSVNFHGFWYDSLKMGKMPFMAREGYGTPGTPEKRYSAFGDFGDEITDGQVEAFALKIKMAVINENKEWIADNTAYPFTSMINMKNVTIKNREALLNNYDKIVTHDVRDRIKSACPYNLDFFQGEAWIDIFHFNSQYDKNELVITSIR